MKIVATLGRGPTLNMLHGWGMHAGIFNDWAHQLAQFYTVNLIDLPGHGENHQESLPVDLTTWSQQAQQLPAGIWLGWSMGGLIALHHALSHPKQVTALVMVCATPCFRARPHWPQGMASQTVSAFAGSLQQDVTATIKRFLALEVLGVQDERQQLTTLQSLIFAKPVAQKQALLNGIRLLHDVDLSPALKNLQPPSLWLSGRRDRIVHPDAMRNAAQQSHGRFELLRGGHAPFLQHHQEMTDIIQDFL